MLQDDGKEIIFEFLGYGRKTFGWEEAAGNANPVRKSSTYTHRKAHMGH
jgi:hypothetical protein